jgi:ketosteroid isomerase-like protein
MSTVLSRVSELQEWIGKGQIIEAMNEFYAPDVTMQENSGPPTTGLHANIEREKQFLSYVKTWKGYNVKALAADEKTGVALVEMTMDFVNQQDQHVHMAQVSVQKWKDGKIVHERFYYDTGKK